MPFVVLVASTVAPATGALSADLVTVPDTIPRSAGIFMPGMFGTGAWGACAALTRAAEVTDTSAIARHATRLAGVIDIMLFLSRRCTAAARPEHGGTSPPGVVKNYLRSAEPYLKSS